MSATAQAAALMILSELFYVALVTAAKFAYLSELRVRGGPEDLVGPWELLFLRCALMTAFSAAFLVSRRGASDCPSLGRVLDPWMAARAALLVGAVVCLYHGSIHVPLSVQGVLSSARAFYLILFAALLLREVVPPLRRISAGVGLLGVTLVLTGGHLAGTAGTRSLPLDYAVAALNGVLWAFGDLAVKKAPKTHWSVSTLCFGIVGAIAALAHFAVAGARWPVTTPGLAFALASGLAGLVAQLLAVRSIQLAPVSVLGLAQYAGPLFALCAGGLFFEEAVTSTKLAGAGLIVLSGLGLPLAAHYLAPGRRLAPEPGEPGHSVAGRAASRQTESWRPAQAAVTRATKIQKIRGFE